RIGRARPFGTLDPAANARHDGIGLDRAWRHSGRTPAVPAERPTRVGADRRADRGDDSFVRRRLRGVPAPGGEGLILNSSPTAKPRHRLSQPFSAPALPTYSG